MAICFVSVLYHGVVLSRFLKISLEQICTRMDEGRMEMVGIGGIMGSRATAKRWLRTKPSASNPMIFKHGIWFLASAGVQPAFIAIRKSTNNKHSTTLCHLTRQAKA